MHPPPRNLGLEMLSKTPPLLVAILRGRDNNDGDMADDDDIICDDDDAARQQVV